MAHDCPECGRLCYCDLEDAMSSIAPADCGHECEPEEDTEFEDMAREAEQENIADQVADIDDDIPF